MSDTPPTDDAEAQPPEPESILPTEVSLQPGQTFATDAQSWTALPRYVRAAVVDLLQSAQVTHVEPVIGGLCPRIELTVSGRDFPVMLTDVIVDHEVTVEDVEYYPGENEMHVRARIEDSFRHTGNRKLRTQAPSYVVTIPPGAMDISELEEDDRVAINARGGELRITRAE